MTIAYIWNLYLFAIVHYPIPTYKYTGIRNHHGEATRLAWLYAAQRGRIGSGPLRSGSRPWTSDDRRADSAGRQNCGRKLQSIRWYRALFRFVLVWVVVDVVVGVMKGVQRWEEIIINRIPELYADGIQWISLSLFSSGIERVGRGGESGWQGFMDRL